MIQELEMLSKFGYASLVDNKFYKRFAGSVALMDLDSRTADIISTGRDGNSFAVAMGIECEMLCDDDFIEFEDHYLICFGGDRVLSEQEVVNYAMSDSKDKRRTLDNLFFIFSTSINVHLVEEAEEILLLIESILCDRHSGTLDRLKSLLDTEKILVETLKK